MNNLHKDIADYVIVPNPQGDCWVFGEADLHEYARQIIQRCITEIALIGVANWESEQITWTTQTAIEHIRERFGIES